MIPLRQTEFTDESVGSVGNCFSTCLASVLEIEPEAVPHFTKLHLDQYERWIEAINAFLRPRGLVYFEIQFGDGLPHYEDMLASVGYHFISGPSPRIAGAGHSCVAKAGKIVWDPHPSEAGLADGYRVYGFLVSRAGG